MARKIQDLTATLRQAKETYQTEYMEAYETRKQERKKLETDYVKGGDAFRTKEQEIEFNFDVSVVKLKNRIAKNAIEEIESLRSWEKSRLEKIDAAAMEQINSLTDVPLTRAEVEQVAQKYPSDYWPRRALTSIAQKNGIDMELELPLDVKLNIISQLEQQMNDLLDNFDPDNKSQESARARHLFLTDSILARAERLYTGGSSEVSALDSIEKSYVTIKAAQSQMKKSILIANTMRNIRGEARDQMLFRLTSDAEISDEAFVLAGIETEAREWRNGKAVRYGEAINFANGLKKKTDKLDIKNTIQNYRENLQKAGQPENEFLAIQIKKAASQNSIVSDALMEMSGIKSAE